MKNYLADTQVLLWAAGKPHKLSRRVSAVLDDPESRVFASPVSAYEILNKYRLGKLPEGREPAYDYPAWLTRLGFQQLPLTTGECARAGLFDVPHADPWDRLLAAQALTHNLPVLSIDSQLDRFPIHRIW